MLILDVQQQTPEWFAARIGVPSASNFDKILTSKGEYSKQAQKYLYQLAGERVSGIREETYQNATMERGIQMEAEARQLYELKDDISVRQVGICYPNEDKKYSCSPDGLVGDDGMIEIKCPLIPAHVGYLLEGVLPVEYFQQVQGQLFITNRKWCDFMSYFPGLRPFFIRVERDEKFIKALAIELEVFCSNLEEVVNKIK